MSNHSGSAPRRTVERNLTLLLLASIAGFTYLARPFLGSLLVAGMVVVVAWPLHARVLKLTRRRVMLAGVISFSLLTLGLFGVLGLAIGIILPEIGRLAADLSAAASGGALQESFAHLSLPSANAWVEDLTGQPTDLAAEVTRAVQSGLAQAAGAVAGAVPTLLQFTGLAILQLLIFLVALGTFLVSGTELVAWIRRVVPLDSAYSDRLMGIFASFSRNVVLASLVGAVAQGSVAGIGYAIAGVERALLFAVLSAAAAVVPLLGPALVWIPLSILMFAQGRTGTGLFIIGWNVALTGTVDNLVKPLVVRGRSNLAPLLVFLGVFGGLSAFGLVGILVGPMVVAMMMALFTIYEDQRSNLSEPDEPPPAR